MPEQIYAHTYTYYGMLSFFLPYSPPYDWHNFAKISSRCVQEIRSPKYQGHPTRNVIGQFC